MSAEATARSASHAAAGDAPPPAVVWWVRRDHRLHDNPALAAALHAARTLGLPLIAWAPALPQAQTRWGVPRLGPHRLQHEAQSLAALQAALAAWGVQLWPTAAPSARTWAALCAHIQPVQVHGQDLPAPEEQDEVAVLTALGMPWQGHGGFTLWTPDDLPWPLHRLPPVFTRFRQDLARAGLTPRAPSPTPSGPWPIASLPPPAAACPRLDAVTDAAAQASGMTPAVPTDVARAVRSSLPPEPAGPLVSAPTDTPPHSSAPWPQWPAGPTGGAAALAHYLSNPDRVARYKQTRNALSDPDASTRLSVWLATGALSPRQVWQALQTHEATHGVSEGSEWIRFEWLWREYFQWLMAQHGAQLFHARGLNPEAPQPRHHAPAFQRWCEGRTGLPLVDAGMRELRATGWLSNRLRQICASALLHELGGDWRAGAAWFEACLLDHDVAANTGNWAYIAGVGTDPRGGRHFDLAYQTRTHDPDGRYRALWGCAS